MTDKYISKDYALYLVNYFGNMLTWSKEDIISEIKRKLSETPAADVVPIFHGHWKRELLNPKIALYGYVCTNCKKMIHIGPDKYMAYCGHCGAKMN